MLPRLSKADIEKILKRINSSRAVDTDYGFDNSSLIELIWLMDATHFLYPFDWVHEFNGGEDPRLHEPAYIANADLDTLRRIIITHVRLNEYYSNHIVSFLNSQAWVVWVERLQQIYDKM